MDYKRLSFGLCFFLLFGLGCSTKSASTTKAEQAKEVYTIFRSKLPASYLSTKTAEFLEGRKTYRFAVKDPARGFFVTDWKHDAPRQRHRVTIRITPDDQGSLLSSHWVTQVQENGDWQVVLLAQSQEQRLIQELKSFLGRSALD